VALRLPLPATLIATLSASLGIAGCDTMKTAELRSEPPARIVPAPATPQAQIALLELDDALSLIAVDTQTNPVATPERTFQLPAGKRQLRLEIRHPQRKDGSSGLGNSVAEISFEVHPGSVYRLMYAADRTTGAGFSQMSSAVTLWRNGILCRPVSRQQWSCP